MQPPVDVLMINITPIIKIIILIRLYLKRTMQMIITQSLLFFLKQITVMNCFRGSFLIY